MDYTQLKPGDRVILVEYDKAEFNSRIVAKHEKYFDGKTPVRLTKFFGATWQGIFDDKMEINICDNKWILKFEEKLPPKPKREIRFIRGRV